MRLVQFVVGFFFSLLATGGYLAFDFSMQNRWARAAGESEITFGSYVMGLVDLARVASSDDQRTGEMPEGLGAMLPAPPPDWQDYALTPQDVALIHRDGKGDRDYDLVRDAMTDTRGRGIEIARRSYQGAPGTVVFELTRYPDTIFTSMMGAAVKFELSSKTASIRSRDFMAVRGFEIREAQLRPDSAYRVFVGDLGGQTHLRVTVPAAMTDLDLLPFFERLHVPAMNANLARPIKGMGEVPVIVLASVMEEETARLYHAEREAARAAEAEEARLAEDEATAARRTAAEAAKAATSVEEAAEGGSTDKTPAPAAADEKAAVRRGVDAGKGKGATDEDGVRVNRGSGGTAKSGKKDNAATIGGGCHTENGRRVCGVPGG